MTLAVERKFRGAWARWLAVATLGVMAVLLAQPEGSRHMMPGPISTAHGSLSDCTSCHANVGQGALGWLHGVLKTSNAAKDAKRCIACHRIGKHALQPHGVAIARLEAYTKRLQSTEAATKTPIGARVRGVVASTDRVFSQGVVCSTCHQEHKGQDGDLKHVSDARCQSCHAVQFNAFEHDHPPFENYPFRRRTRINFDHNSHFNKHFPEWKKKGKSASETPEACSQCHAPTRDTGFMRVKSFNKVCSACHLGQIVGEGRLSGPNGIALLALPGIDVETLQEKNISIGEWPVDAEGDVAGLTKLLVGSRANGRQLLQAIDGLDLFDLTAASDQQLQDVAALVWEIKHLFYALLNGRTEDVLKRVAGAETETKGIAAKLAGRLPHDVLLGAQREWLPKLFEEVDTARFDAWLKATTVVFAGQPPLPVRRPGRKPAAVNKVEGPGKAVKDAEAEPTAAVASVSGPWRIDAFGRLLKGGSAPSPGEDEAFLDETQEADLDAGDTDGDADTGVLPEPQPALPTGGEDARFGGWFRKDFAVLFKPTGHADEFVRAWLDVTAKSSARDASGLKRATFDELTHEDGVGRCTKCHSVDAAADNVRQLQWRPATNKTRDSLFTRFNHLPHFGIVGDKGCLACHALSSAKGYQESYKAHDPNIFVSNFKPVRQEDCAACHRRDKARSDCRFCHTYHVPGVVTPVEATRIPK